MNLAIESRLALNEESVDTYNEKGYFLPKHAIFTEEKFTRLKDIFEELLIKKGDDLDHAHFDEPRLFEFLMDEEVLDMVESVIGPNIGLWSSHFISKEAKTGKATPWHEDSGYWNGRFEDFSSIMTIWLAIDPSNKSNGCLKVMPGSHLKDDYIYEKVDSSKNIFDRGVVNAEESEAVYFELEPNHCSLHDSKILHSAEENTGTQRRCGYTMRYFSLDMKFLKDSPRNQGHKLWHCRGENIGENPLIYLD